MENIEKMNTAKEQKCDSCVNGWVRITENGYCTRCTLSQKKAINCLTGVKSHYIEITVPTTTDNVKHPSHYTYGKIECIDFILDKELDFSLGNAVKYIVRAGRKNPEKQIEDLQKAIQYIQFEIEHLEGGR